MGTINYYKRKPNPITASVINDNINDMNEVVRWCNGVMKFDLSQGDNGIMSIGIDDGGKLIWAMEGDYIFKRWGDEEHFYVAKKDAFESEYELS